LNASIKEFNEANYDTNTQANAVVNLRAA